MIKAVGNQTIDFSKVERVGPVEESDKYKTYKVYFTGGGVLDFFHEVKHPDSIYFYPVKRYDFIKMWKECKNGILLSVKDSEVFFDAIVNPGEPNEALKKAMAKYLKRYE